MNTPVSELALRYEAHQHAVLRQRILEQVPDIDAETLADTLEGLTNLDEILIEVLRSALDDEALVAGLKSRLLDMESRLERLGGRAKRKRQLALAAMADAGVSRLTAPEFSASLRQGAVGVEIVSLDDIPAAFWKPQPPKIDKQGLLVALKAGTEVQGATLAPSQIQLSIRTK